MSETDKSGPAFPCVDGPPSEYFKGMTLRDYFAGQAIASIPNRQWGHVEGGDAAIIEAWANCAYAVADAMLKAREA